MCLPMPPIMQLQLLARYMTCHAVERLVFTPSGVAGPFLQQPDAPAGQTERGGRCLHTNTKTKTQKDNDVSGKPDGSHVQLVEATLSEKPRQSRAGLSHAFVHIKTCCESEISDRVFHFSEVTALGRLFVGRLCRTLIHQVCLDCFPTLRRHERSAGWLCGGALASLSA